MRRYIHVRFKFAILLAAVGVGVIFVGRLAASPNPPVTNNGVVIFQGDQSQGITNAVDPTVPANVLVTNLSGNITPPSGTPGIQMVGQVSTTNLNLSVDSSGSVFTSGDGAYGIHIINSGGFNGSYQLVTNSYTILTNTNGTITIVTNFENGGSNSYAASIPVGGAILNNKANITTGGNAASGIFAESQPGTISFTFSTNASLSPQPYGNAGIVNVVNSGNISTSGTNSHGIFAQSLGGYGPENSDTSGNGEDISVSTVGGTITTIGSNSFGIYAQSRGGDNVGGESGGLVHDGHHGGLGGNAGNVAITGGGTISTSADNAGGIFALSQAGNGGPGGNGGSIGGAGGDGGNGGQGSNVVVSGNWNITTRGTNANGITAQSLGGVGGNGGGGSPFINLGAGNGGGTANGGNINVSSAGTIVTGGAFSQGIFARSLGGFAGNGGDSYSAFYGDAGSGNSAGAGGDVAVLNMGSITTHGSNSQAIYAESVGGGGGEGGSGGGLVTLGSSGGAGGNAGQVIVTNQGTLLTFGDGSHGIEAESLGGGGGDGGNAGGLVALGGTGSTGSTSSVVIIQNMGQITTHGNTAHAILAQSIGGGGGNAGSGSGVAALGGSGSGGGDGAAVFVFNAGALTNTGSNSYGILAQSIGGGGGTGGGGSGLVGIGGSGGSASKSDVVNVYNMGDISSTSSSIFAQSIGGGGGNGGNGAGWAAVGGSGNGGGDGAAVNVTNTGNLHTTETNASAIFAQSIGGGGGNGGNSVAVGAAVSVAVGGNGALGGNSSTVRVVSGTNVITTRGANSFGIEAESVGGGGGTGGYAVSVAVGDQVSASLAIGGQGGGGGDGSNVTVSSQSTINTTGTNSHGIFAQSVGGGGGAGGFAVSGAVSSGVSVSLAMGGSGGNGGAAGNVTASNSGAITTQGEHSYGMLVQSVGGGGGDGGFSISGGFSADGSAPFSFGGSGATGGVGRVAMVFNSGAILTRGNDSHAIEVQSVGGGGGSGGFSVSGGASSGGTLGASFGGSGKGGGSGDQVGLTNTAGLTTYGDRSYGVLAQSLGGGGGNGGFSVAGDISKSPALSLSLGGSGAGGGNGASVTVSNTGAVATHGANAHGIFAQSLGGGGGAGGFSVSGSISQGASASLSIGGQGGGGGHADTVTVDNSGSITTEGTNSSGILAQSIGGGGGDGGFSVAGDIGKGPAATFSMGGAGGSGDYGGAVTVNNTGNITTHGALSYGIFAESLGGGGGSGGFSVSGTLTQNSSGVSLTIGGPGGPGSDGAVVTLGNSGNITTTNEGSHAIFAESVGGGGGAGGFGSSLTGNLKDGATLSVAVGGTGGSGGAASAVNVTNSGTLRTFGNGADGLFAQSVGGGGGDGGFGLAAAIGLSKQAKNVSLAIGGNGGAGGFSRNVTVENTGGILTLGSNSAAILAQSIGGGGGTGGFAASGSFGTGSNSAEVAVSIGGAGSNGNYAGSVKVTNYGQIITSNYNSAGILAQSIGGSGGDGGMAFSGSLSQASGKTKNVSLAIGGQGGDGGYAGTVTVAATSDIFTAGDQSHGIFAQSVGGGGGNGGLAAAIDLSAGTSGTNYQFAVSVGGAAGNGNTASNVFVGGTNTITTTGDGAYGVFAQSIGGGGGAGGFSLAATGTLSLQQGTNKALTVAVGGAGGSGNNAGDVAIDRVGDITTFGDGSYGIAAESIGGGGGDGGGARSFSLFARRNGTNNTNTSSKSINVSVGGNGAGASYGGQVLLTNVGNITTAGADAYGILAQSIGGGGGAGGAAHTSTNDLSLPGADLLNNKAVSTDATQYQIVVGGQGASGGDGSNVIVNQTGNVTTFGTGSYGIFAQSIGDGGGVGGAGAVADTTNASIAIGGAGGASGNGGAVTVTVNGNIFTAGDGAAAIFAQSVGGGGGVAGNVDTGLTNSAQSTGKGFAYEQSGGSGGTGSTVTVTSKGNITTMGNGAYGIFAQSIGGGGGLTGGLGTNNLPLIGSILNFAGSVGGAGDGGNVNVTHTGVISTYGTNATAIFVQSQGGANGVGGAVNVTLNGSIFANGVGADGIYAQSGGGSNSAFGNATVTISSNSIVQGGTGNGAGVRFMDGNTNTLQNYGLVTSLNGLTGTNLVGTVGSDIINNYGITVGSIDLGGGTNFFNNTTNGGVMAGSAIMLGGTNLFANAGILALGDTNTITRTLLTGNFVQSSNGSTQVKLGSPASYDALTIAGKATLDGNLSVFRYTNYLPVRGAEFTVLTASNISGQYASLSDPYLGNYAIRLKELYSATNLILQVVQDSFMKFAFTGNQRSVAQNLNSFDGMGQTNGDPRGKALIDFLDTVPAAQLPTDLDLIAPDEFGSMFDLSFASVNLAIGNLQQRMREIRNGHHSTGGSISMFNSNGQQIQLASADHALPQTDIENQPDDWAVFVSGNGQYVDLPGTSAAPGYHFHNSGATVGVDKLIRTNLAFGFTADYAGTLASLPNDGEVKVDGGRGGIYGTWFTGEDYVQGSFGGGYNHYRTSRVSVGGTASGSTGGYEIDAMLGGGHDFRQGDLLFGPALNAQYTHVQVNGFTESGSLAPLQLEDNRSDSFLTRLGAHIGYDWKLPEVTLRPDLQVAWQHEYLDQDRAISSRMANGVGNIFTVNSPEIGRDSVAVDAALYMQWTHTFSTFLVYHGDLARQDYVEHSISGGVGISF
jgi:uncharacterized protein YhjY with autotransporter beta-barrel domain